MIDQAVLLGITIGVSLGALVISIYAFVISFKAYQKSMEKQ